MAGTGGGILRFRVLTANVQSFPDHALTLDEAQDDLKRNADVADIVLLQEIADRYRPLVERAFPSLEWDVYYGRKDNNEPIAFRKRLFRRLDQGVTQLHPGIAGLHGRRNMTWVRLAAESNGAVFNVTNLHLVSGGFVVPPKANRAFRVKEWNEGIAKHLTFVDSLVETGEPVLGGGDYNRQLRRHPSLGAEVGDRLVKYAVDPGSIDLLWFLDGTDGAWSLRSREVFAGRDDGKRPERNSDHAARLAVVELGRNIVGGTPFYTPGRPADMDPHPTNKPKPKPKPKHENPPKPDKPAEDWPQPFEKTTFGDTKKYQVDWKTRAALEEAERRLGYTLTLYQGSYSTKVSASGGTHDGGGVVDLAPEDHEHKVKVLRTIGFAAWYRPKTDDWNPHIHAVLIDHGKLSPEAQSQVVQYRQGTDGLRSHAKDPTPRPKPIPVFRYPPKDHRESGAGYPADSEQPGSLPGSTGSHGSNGISGSSYPPKRMLDGVDTSHHQAGKIDLRKAQHAGLRWWYVKTTDGETTVDVTYRKRVREARRAGVPVGSYHFARPDGGDALREAEHFLESSEILLGDMVPMLDLEGREVLSREQLTKWVGVWVTTVRRELAKRGLSATPIIYTSFDLDDAFGCKLWVARYSNDFREPRIPSPWKRAAIWQHSDGKVGPIRHVPGFGAVDVNAMHPDLPLSALRVRRPHGAGGNDLDHIRRDLQVAMRRLDDALDRLPERDAS
jgi:GH25 family lysozyme M1 (1,4-beta-N-acetylmuramidase)